LSQSSGEIKTYPGRNGISPEANQVEYVICPARIDAKVAEKKAEQFTLHVSEKFNHVGLLAVVSN
jgi:5-(carboxyamino)imidazole ribonucleotide synthase